MKKKYTYKQVENAFKRLNNKKSKNILKDEKIIATSPYNSLIYAEYVIEKRFLLGEKIISKYPNYVVEYASNVLKGRFLLGEKNLKKSLEIERYRRFVLEKTPPLNILFL